MTECLIIGSGIVGLITAYELRKSGYKITVIESRRSGQASKSAAGILFPINPWENKKNMQDPFTHVYALPISSWRRETSGDIVVWFHAHTCVCGLGGSDLN